MSGKSNARKQLFVDPRMQGALVLRVALYWIVCLITISLMVLCWRVFTQPAAMFATHVDQMCSSLGPALVASLLVLPLIAIDVIRLSNRFAGPMLRLRRNMRALARGEAVQPIEFRQDDFWREFAEDFNALVARMQSPSQAGRPDLQRERGEPVGAAAD